MPTPGAARLPITAENGPKLVEAFQTRDHADVCAQTGATVSYRRNEYDYGDKIYFTHQGKGPEEIHTSIKEKRLPALSAVSRTPDGTVVGATKDALVEVPLKGTDGGFWKRLGWSKLNTIVALPAPAEAIDVGPKGEIAVSQGNQVLRWTESEGLQPWIELPNKVHSLQFLKDGELGLRTEANECFLVDQAGQSIAPLEFKAVCPEDYRTGLWQGLGSPRWLEKAPVDVIERFAATHSGKEGWWADISCSVFDEKLSRAALVDGKGTIRLYDLEQGREAVWCQALAEPRSMDDNLHWSKDGRYLTLLQRNGYREEIGDLMILDLTEARQLHLPNVDHMWFKNDQAGFTTPEGEKRVGSPEALFATGDQEPWAQREHAFGRVEWKEKGKGFTVRWADGREQKVPSVHHPLARRFALNHENSRLEDEYTFSADRHFLIHRDRGSEMRSDVTIWNLETCQASFIPGASDSKVTRDGYFCFTAPDGEKISIALSRVDELARSPWYQDALDNCVCQVLTERQEIPTLRVIRPGEKASRDFPTLPKADGEVSSHETYDGKYLAVWDQSRFALWDLQKAECLALPDLKSLQVGDQSVTFQVGKDEPRTFAFEDLAQVKGEKWFEDASRRELLGGGAAESGTIEKKDEEVVIGGVHLQKNK